MHFTPIPGFPGYSISACGKVMGTRNKLLKTPLTVHGYPYVRLRGTFKTVHRIVAEVLIPKVNGKGQVNHKDGNKTNNHISNLEWCTQSENALHAFATGLQDSPPGDVGNKRHSIHSVYHNVGYYPARGKWVARMSIAGKVKLGGYFDTEVEAARKVNSMIDQYGLDRPKNIV